MPRNKKTLYLLFPLVIIIWGLVIYRVVGTLGDEAIALPSVAPTVSEQIKRVKRDTFSLLPIDRDPFLGHHYKKAAQPEFKPATPAKAVEWPEISYLGLVSDSGQSSGVHILQVNGKQVLIENGGSAEEVKIVGSASGQVSLLYQGDKRTFSKGNGS